MVLLAVFLVYGSELRSVASHLVRLSCSKSTIMKK